MTAESSDAVSTKRPSGENVASCKWDCKLHVCPASVETYGPVATFQMWQVPSDDVVSAAVRAADTKPDSKCSVCPESVSKSSQW